MSFLFGRKQRPNTVDLSKQAKDFILKLDGPGGAAKVYILFAHWKVTSELWMS